MQAIDLDDKLILKNSISRFPEGLTRDSLSELAEAAVFIFCQRSEMLQIVRGS